MSHTACRKYFQGITASHLRYSHHVFLRNDSGNSHLNIRQTALPRRFAATAHRAHNPRNGSGDGATDVGRAGRHMVREFGQIRAEIGLPFRRHGFQTFGDATGNTALSVDRRPSHARAPCRIARLAPRRTPSPPHAVSRVRRSGLSDRLHQAEPHPASTLAHPRWASTGTTTERTSSAITKSRPCISARARAIAATLRRPRGDTPNRTPCASRVAADSATIYATPSQAPTSPCGMPHGYHGPFRSSESAAARGYARPR